MPVYGIAGIYPGTIPRQNTKDGRTYFVLGSGSLIEGLFPGFGDEETVKLRDVLDSLWHVW
jgi:hypothetical protein